MTKAYDFYTTVLGFAKMPQFDHKTASGELFAVICQHEPSKQLVEIRKNPEQAIKQKHWDPITWSVETRDDLDRWISWFDQHNVKHSEIFVAMKSWLLVAEDPDGRFVKFMTKETHEWTTDFSKDDYWLG